MGQPVVHFEIQGKDPEMLRRYYGELFGWEFELNSPVAEAVSEAGSYGFINRNATDEGEKGVGIPGGIGGGEGYTGYAIFYVGVPDVEEALQKAEQLGGKRVMGPAKNPNGMLVVGHFTDPEGHLVGVAGPK
jgi:predicted enzyme related to lactoylglutathione lyase